MIIISFHQTDAHPNVKLSLLMFVQDKEQALAIFVETALYLHQKTVMTVIFKMETGVLMNAISNLDFNASKLLPNANICVETLQLYKMNVKTETKSQMMVVHQNAELRPAGPVQMKFLLSVLQLVETQFKRERKNVILAIKMEIQRVRLIAKTIQKSSNNQRQYQN